MSDVIEALIVILFFALAAAAVAACDRIGSSSNGDAGVGDAAQRADRAR